jgi:hypothetical protein
VWSTDGTTSSTSTSISKLVAWLGLGFSQRRGRATGSRPAIAVQNMSGTP